MGLNRRDFLKGLVIAIGGFIAWTKWGPHFSSAQTSQSGIAGTVTSIIDDRPIADAFVSVPDIGGVFTDANGRYSLPLPSGSYEVRVDAAGFISMRQVAQEVHIGETIVVDFRLIPLDPTSEQERTIIAKLGIPSQGPTATLPPIPLFDRAGVLAVPIPSTIQVEIESICRTMLLEDYVKGVVAAEMPASWPAEALKAQAVAARTYGVVSYINNGYRCIKIGQAYTDYRYSTTNAAVDATRGQVITYGGSIVATHYFSSCGTNGTRNSEDAINWRDCSRAGWNYVPYERRKECQGLHDNATRGPCGYYGHGVGMCQYGARERAKEGLNYLRILRYYYKDIDVYGAPVPPAPPLITNPPNGQFIVPAVSAVTLQWSAVPDATYDAEIELVNSSWRDSKAEISSTSWNVAIPGLGLYRWRVRSRNINGVGDFSEYFYFVNSNTIYKTFLPNVNKNSTGGW